MSELMPIKEALSELVRSVKDDTKPRLAEAARRISQLVEHGYFDKCDIERGDCVGRGNATAQNARLAMEAIAKARGRCPPDPETAPQTPPPGSKPTDATPQYLP